MSSSILQLLFPETLTQEDIKKFITLGDEEVIIALREHSIPLLFKLSQLGTIAAIITIGGAIATYFLSYDLIFSIAVFLTLGLMSTGLIIRELIHWYFHLYLITTKKIIEVRYNPLFSEISNSVLLEQLRCTEIDAEMHGFISEILDLGNVAITFDRPTHQEQFILKNVRSPRKVANHLSAYLHSDRKKQQIDTSQEMWFKNLHTGNRYQFTESTTYGGNN